MIVVKPKNSTLFSLGVFITFSLVAAGYGMQAYFKDQAVWYHYVGLFVFGPLGLGLLMRTLLKYSIYNIGKGSIAVRTPVRFSNRQYKLSQISYWRETSVKTAGGNFKEVEIKFDNKKSISLSMQEHSNYPQLINYLKKKAPKKMVS